METGSLERAGNALSIAKELLQFVDGGGFKLGRRNAPDLRLTARGPDAVARFLRPRSAAIIGMSQRPGSAGQVILQSLKVNNFKGDIHLVGRTDEPIEGRPVLKSAADLPPGIDLAVFTLPAAALLAAGLFWVFAQFLPKGAA